MRQPGMNLGADFVHRTEGSRGEQDREFRGLTIELEQVDSTLAVPGHTPDDFIEGNQDRLDAVSLRQAPASAVEPIAVMDARRRAGCVAPPGGTKDGDAQTR